MNTKQRNAIVRLRKAMDNFDAAFAEPKRRNSVTITQGKKVDKKTLAPHYAAKKRKGKAVPKGHGMSKAGGQK